jgi:hypothetical protein
MSALPEPPEEDVHVAIDRHVRQELVLAETNRVRNSSDRQRLLKLAVDLFNAWVVSEPQDVPTIDPGHPSNQCQWRLTIINSVSR